MSSGWIKLYRKVLDSRVFANEGLFKVWIYCLCRANHETNYVSVKTGQGETEIKVNGGEFIFGRNSCANDLNMNPSTLYKRMKKLEGMENIKIQSNSQYSVVSICNWDTYQHIENKKEQPSNSQVTGKEQPSNTDNNDKNDKNDKKTSKARARANEVPIPEHLQISGFADRYEDYVEYRMEQFNLKTGFRATDAHFRKLIELKQKGNDPLKVIDQTMGAGHKKFYEIDDYSSNGKKEMTGDEIDAMALS